MDQHAPGIYKTPECVCLNCGEAMNATAKPQKPDDELPEDGAIVVCLRCGAAMAYDSKLGVRGFTEKEIDEIMADPDALNDLAKTVKAVQFIRQVMPSRN